MMQLMVVMMVMVVVLVLDGRLRALRHTRRELAWALERLVLHDLDDLDDGMRGAAAVGQSRGHRGGEAEGVEEGGEAGHCVRCSGVGCLVRGVVGEWKLAAGVLRERGTVYMACPA